MTHTKNEARTIQYGTVAALAAVAAMANIAHPGDIPSADDAPSVFGPPQPPRYRASFPPQNVNVSREAARRLRQAGRAGRAGR